METTELGITTKPAAMNFPFEGPCMRPVGSTTPCNMVADVGLDRLWASNVSVAANTTITLTMDLSGTDNLMPPGTPGMTQTDLPPGTYRFHGPGGMPLTLTVLPKP